MLKWQKLRHFTLVYWTAAKSESDDSEEETKSTRSKKKSNSGSASMFQTSADKDKDKKTKKKGKFITKAFLCCIHRQAYNISVVFFSKGRRKQWFWIRKRRKNKEEEGQREEEKSIWLQTNQPQHFSHLMSYYTSTFTQSGPCFKMFLSILLYQERSPSPEIEFDNLEKFVMEPAPQGVTVKCRVTRDQRGMDKSLYPLYYLHLDNEKKVSIMF